MTEAGRGGAGAGAVGQAAQAVGKVMASIRCGRTGVQTPRAARQPVDRRGRTGGDAVPAAALCRLWVDAGSGVSATQGHGFKRSVETLRQMDDRGRSCGSRSVHGRDGIFSFASAGPVWARAGSDRRQPTCVAEDRGLRCSLIAFVDDATGRLQYAHSSRARESCEATISGRSGLM